MSVEKTLPFNEYVVCLNCSRERKVSRVRLVVLQTLTEIKAGQILNRDLCFKTSKEEFNTLF